MIKKFLPYVLVTLSIAVIVYLGFQKAWYEQLSGDYKYYYSLADHFFNTHQMTGFKDVVSYPPAANVFFILLGSVFFLDHSLAAYQTALIGINVLFLIILAKIYHDLNGSTGNFFAFCLIIVCIGPLMIFRFDLLAVLFTALSIATFKKEKNNLSIFLLAMATLTKIFPMVLLPYFLLLTFKKTKSLIPPIKLGILFSVTILISAILYMLVFNDKPSSIFEMLNYNFAKSVHIESLLGTVLVAMTMVKYPGAHEIGFFNGLFVLTPLYFFGHSRIFRFTNMVGFAFTYALIVFSWKRITKMSVEICLIIILTLIVTSQVISPQYLIWPFLLVPLLPVKRLATRFWKINLILIALIFLCTQYVYPLHYNELIFNFFGSGKSSEVFWVNFSRNIFILALTVRLWFSFLFKSSEAGEGQ